MLKKILVVDDDPSVLDLSAAWLSKAGYASFTAESGDEALAQLEGEGEFELVLVDLLMPQMDGLMLLDAIAADFPSTPVVVVTAVEDIRVAISAFRHGSVDYLLKPFDQVQLLEVVDRAVHHGEVRRRSLLYQRNLEQVVHERTQRLRATMQDLERSYDTTLEAMGDALDLRDAETEGHSRRVTAYTIALARAFGVTAEDLRVIARGAFLHDIGKIATPDAILLKPGGLDKDEMKIMREHCERGYQMVRKIPFLREASEIVYAHQERWDGTGYPRGLRGEQIPLGARIFAIADTLDAITSDRPYRRGRSFEDARAEIELGAGTQFDPEIVSIFLAIATERWIRLRKETARATLLAMSANLTPPLQLDLAS